MRRLLADPAEAQRLGANARAVAHDRFGLPRFINAWNAAFTRVIEGKSADFSHKYQPDVSNGTR